MRLAHEFTVAAPLEPVWVALSDGELFASAIPGAELRRVDGVYTGRIAVEGDRRAACDASLATIDRDDDEHAVTLRLRGRQLGGPVVGTATIRGRTSAERDATRVQLTVDVEAVGFAPVNGVERSAQALLEELGQRLCQGALEWTPSPRDAGPPSAPAATPAASTPDEVASAPAGARALSGAANRRLVLTGVVGGLLLVLLLSRRGRRTHSLW